MRLNLSSLLPLAIVLALSACNAGPSVDDQATAPTQLPPPMDQPSQDVPPATAPKSVTGPARYDGYGALRFGMTAAEVREAWEGELNGTPDQGASGESQPCYYLNPVGNPSPAYFAFMIERDKFVRYDVGNDKEVAPGGGKRGMTIDQIKALYPDRVKTSPHKYVDGGKYLRVKASDGSGGVLVFEADPDGKVTQWRAGQPPQVDYVEGCS